MSDPIEWSPVKVKLSALTFWADNPKTLTKAQAAKLEASTKKLGRAGILSVGPAFADGKRDLYDGHQRAVIWRTLYGPDFEVWCLEASRALTTDERKNVAVLMAVAVGSFDWDKLSGWDDLQSYGLDSALLADWKRDTAALDNFLKSEQPEPQDAEPQIDRAAELNEKWQVKTGDLWRIGEHRLLCGDSTEREDVARVMGGERAGACVTDSPYGINREGIENDDPEGLRALFDAVLSCFPIENGVIINFQSPRLFPAWMDAIKEAGQLFKRALWMYDENDQTKPWHYWLMCSQIAIISTVGKPEWLETKGHHDTYVIGLSREWRAGGDGNDFAHASVKPAGVVQDILAHIGGDVYEPFAGSGTTLVACQNLSRKCRAIEISPNYCAVILERMATAFPGIEIERL